MPESPATPAQPVSLRDAAGQVALDVARAAAKDLTAESRKDRTIAWKVFGIVTCVGMAFVFGYLVIKDLRDGHAMTQEEYASANKARDGELEKKDKERSEALAKDNKERDDKLALVRADFQLMTSRLAAALEGVAALKAAQDAIGRDVKDSESRLRAEIQGTNSRIDRVLEAVNRPR